MRLQIKKIAAASIMALSMIVFSTQSSISRDSLLDLSPKVVYAAENDISSDVINALDKINRVDKDGDDPHTSKEEERALWKIMRDPDKYLSRKTDGSTLDKIKMAMQKPKTFARAAGEAGNVDTVLSKLQNRLNKIEIDSGHTDHGDIGVTDTTSKDLDYLTGNENYSSLYASIIYSLSKGDSADNASISLAQMMKYPVKDNGNTSQQYGNLATPSFLSSVQPEGGKLASYIRTLYEYNYLVMKDKTGFSGIWNFLTGWVGSTVRAVLLSTAWLGAAVYDMSFNLIKWFTQEFTKVNILQVTGLQAGAARANSVITEAFEGMFKTAGLSSATIKAVQYLIYIIIIGSFMILVISQLNKAKSKQAVKTTKRFGLRILTIIMTIPITAMMYSISANLFNGLNIIAEDASRVSDSYVINVTRWAGTLNLSLAPINGGNFSPDGKINSNFEPTPNNIAKINAASRAIEDASGGKSDARSAMETIESIMQDKESSVQDYFNFIASRETSGSNIAAEGFPTTQVTDSRGRANSYMLVSRDKKIDASELVKIILSIAKDKDSGKVNDEAAKSYTYNVANKEDVTISLDSKYDLTPVVWNNPTSYLYGAVTPGNLTSSTLNHNNYHLSAYTNMLNDPKTGELAKDNNLQDALKDNAISFALINKYAGIKSYGGGSNSLSSQSVAFLLQSKLSDGTLVYKGFNTAANSAGSSKNTGPYGITYVENVVPSKNTGDYLSKIASLNAIWLAAGISAFVTLLALIKAPILGALFRHLKGFFSALFFGNTVALIESILYYIALSSSFIFAYLGVILSLGIVNAIVGSDSVLSGVAWLSYVPIFGPIFMSWLICFILTWPVVKLRLGASNKPRSIGIAAMMVSVPFLLVESMDATFDRFERNLFNKSRSASMLGNISKRAEVIDQGSLAKGKIKSGANKALDTVQALGSAIPGYGTAATFAAGAAKGLLNADKNDPNLIENVAKTGLATMGDTAGVNLLGSTTLNGKSDPTALNDKKKPIDDERDVDMTNDPKSRITDLQSNDKDNIDPNSSEISKDFKDPNDPSSLEINEHANPEDEGRQILEQIAKNTARLNDQDDAGKDPVEVDIKKDESERSDESKGSKKSDTAEEIETEKLRADRVSIDNEDRDSHLVRDANLEELKVDYQEVAEQDTDRSNVERASSLDPNALKVEETPKETQKETPNETQKETTKETLKETLAESPKETKTNSRDVDIKMNPEAPKSSVIKDAVVSKLGVDESTTYGANDMTDFVAKTIDKVKSAPDGVKAAIDPISSSAIARAVGDSVTAAVTGKSLDQVKLEKHSEREKHDKEVIIKQQTKEAEKQILKERLVQENIARGMSDSDARLFAGLQEAIGKVASSPAAKVAHQAAKPFAMAADNTLFNGQAKVQKALDGKFDESRKDSYGSRSSNNQDQLERQNNKLLDALDRLSDDIKDSQDDRHRQ